MDSAPQQQAGQTPSNGEMSASAAVAEDILKLMRRRLKETASTSPAKEGAAADGGGDGAEVLMGEGGGALAGTAGLSGEGASAATDRDSLLELLRSKPQLLDEMLVDMARERLAKHPSFSKETPDFHESASAASAPPPPPPASLPPPEFEGAWSSSHRGAPGFGGAGGLRSLRFGGRRERRRSFSRGRSISTGRGGRLPGGGGFDGSRSFYRDARYSRRGGSVPSSRSVSSEERGGPSSSRAAYGGGPPSPRRRQSPLG